MPVYEEKHSYHRRIVFLLGNFLLKRFLEYLCIYRIVDAFICSTDFLISLLSKFWIFCNLTVFTQNSIIFSVCFSVHNPISFSENNWLFIPSLSQQSNVSNCFSVHILVVTAFSTFLSEFIILHFLNIQIWAFSFMFFTP